MLQYATKAVSKAVSRGREVLSPVPDSCRRQRIFRSARPAVVANGGRRRLSRGVLPRAALIFRDDAERLVHLDRLDGTHLVPVGHAVELGAGPNELRPEGGGDELGRAPGTGGDRRARTSRHRMLSCAPSGTYAARARVLGGRVCRAGVVHSPGRARCSLNAPVGSPWAGSRPVASTRHPRAPWFGFRRPHISRSLPFSSNSSDWRWIILASEARCVASSAASISSKM